MANSFKTSTRTSILFLVILQLFLVTDMQSQINFDPIPQFFRTKREMPLLSLATKKDIYVATYGALINDGKDDLDAIKAAIKAASAAASASSPVRLIFEKGTYDVKPPTGASHCIFVTNANNIVFQGNGAEILNHNPSIGLFEIKSCTNIIFKDLFIDYAILPYTQGVVTAVDLADNSFTLQIDAGFPLLTESHFTTAGQKWGCLKDVTGKLKTGAYNLFQYKGWTQISGNTFKVKTASNTLTSQVKVNDYYVQIARNNGKSIFHSVASKNITYLGITIYSAPAGSFSGAENWETNIINCKVLPKPGSGRVQSGNADIVHITGSYIGPWVEGCHFEAYTDDAVNLKHTRRNIVEIVSPTVLKIKGRITLNDKIVLFNPREGIEIGRSLNILKVRPLESSIFEITLTAPHNVTVVGEHQTADKMYLTNQSCESFIFRNTTFKNGRRYGILLQSSYGQVENCRFENLSSSGVKMENGVDWSEGFIANNIIITANTFNNCGFDTSYVKDEDAAAISTGVSKLKMPCDSGKWCGVELSNWQGLKYITITNNTFIYNKAAINLHNINNGLIANNTFTHNPDDKTLKPNEKPQEIVTPNCTNINFGTK